MASRGGGTAGTAGIGAALARFYDLDLLDDPSDVPMYLALAAKSGGRVLELCAGSGRISVPLAAAGHSVTAVDRDPNMLDRARRAWKRHPARKAGGSLKLIEHDITLLDLEDRFDLVIVALNSLVLLDGQAAQEAALRTIARHLAPGGRAVVDVWLPDDGDLELYDGRLMLEWVRRDPDSGAWVAKIGSVRYDPSTAAAELTTFFETWADGEQLVRTMRQDTVHFLAATELVRLARRVGLAVETKAGDYDLLPFGAESDRLVVVLRGGRSYGGRSGRG